MAKRTKRSIGLAVGLFVVAMSLAVPAYAAKRVLYIDSYNAG